MNCARRGGGAIKIIRKIKPRNVIHRNYKSRKDISQRNKNQENKTQKQLNSYRNYKLGRFESTL